MATAVDPPPPGEGERRRCYAFPSGISAKVHTEPPVGIFPAAQRLARPPPSPDATLTYCLPLYVKVIAVALTLEPVLNDHSVLPVSSSRATNSPVSLPVKMSPPSVASVPAEP